MEGEANMKVLLEGADQVNHPYNRIYQLQNLRQMKNNIAEESKEVTKSQILHRMNTKCAYIQSIEDEIEAKITKITKKIPAVLDRLSRAETIQTLNNVLLEDRELSSQPSTNFLSIIQLLGTLYSTAKDQKFFQQQEQLLNILNMMKNYELPDIELKNIESQYQKLSQEKNTIQTSLLHMK